MADVMNTDGAVTALEKAERERVFDTMTWLNRIVEANDPNDFEIRVQVYGEMHIVSEANR